MEDVMPDHQENTFNLRSFRKRLQEPRMLPAKPLSQQTIVYSTESQRLAPMARNLVWVLFILAIANGIFLYIFPHLAETHYAWSIKSPISAAFMGAGYLAGMVATGLALFRTNYWRSVRILFPAFFVLGLSLFIATMLHTDRFKWDYFLTWIWTVVYFSIPIGSGIVWYIHEKTRNNLPSRDSRLNPIRQTSFVLGIGVTLLASLLFIFPTMFLEVWPWQITPLLARVFAGWYFLAGVILLFAPSLRQANEIPIAFATLVAWSVLSLLLPVLHSSSIHLNLGFIFWISLHSVLLLQTTWATFMAVNLMNQEEQDL
jgi:hypothetical protein